MRSATKMSLLTILLPWSTITVYMVSFVSFLLLTDTSTALLYALLPALISVPLFAILFYLTLLKPLSSIAAATRATAEHSDGDDIVPLSIREFSCLIASINEIARKAKRHDQIRKDFVANVSHELKTPITMIKGYVEVLRGEQPPNPKTAASFLKIIDEQTDRMTAIVNDLLVISYSEMSGSDNITSELISMSELAERTVHYTAPLAEEKQVTVHTDLHVPGIVHGNHLLLEQLIVNLLENAIKYSQAETSVHIAVHETDTSVILTVQDEGVGIAVDHIDRIFERFYRVDKARSRAAGGTGLGLAIVKHVAQLHGGTVSVVSRVGEGSTFTVTFPRRKTRSN